MPRTKLNYATEGMRATLDRVGNKSRSPAADLCQTVRNLVSTILVAGVALGAQSVSAMSCESLITLRLPDATITSAISMPGPSFTAPDGKTYAGLPPFCQVTATLTPSTDSLINIWVWMPTSNWNGRFEGHGNGGYAGSITVAVAAMMAGLQTGSAVASTDMGTAPATITNADVLFGHPEKWIDFGNRSTHVMTVASKQIIAAFYVQAPRYAYFSGCSTGGQQALMEAQRYPDDYDGIMAGDPGDNRTHVHTSFLWNYAALHRTPQSYLTYDQVDLITNSVVAACAVESGGLATDPFLTDPRNCDWDPSQLACTSPLQTNCLNADQVQAAKAIYDGPRNPSNGHLIYPGSVKGGENSFLWGWVMQESSPEPLFDSLFKWIFGPTWLWSTYDYNRDMATVDSFLAPILNANSADLSYFKARGGKLLMFHGWADPIVPPWDSINYYNRVIATQGKGSKALKATQSFARLFMVPGLWHCTQGPGPNAFGNLEGSTSPAPPLVKDPAHDAFLALQQWVERGVAPERIIATKYVYDQPSQGVEMTRPICAYPKLPRYGGSGDTNDAASFVCVNSNSTNSPVPAPEYLQ
jgi:feruloyl esterase